MKKNYFQRRRKIHHGSFVPSLPLRQEQQHPENEDQHDDGDDDGGNDDDE